ncbi:MAG: tetratricopeptide repeat protein [Bacteroidales bacterium]|nr:tetratricopeptide repeat protein [Bacteroidales bacterium]
MKVLRKIALSIYMVLVVFPLAAQGNADKELRTDIMRLRGLYDNDMYVSVQEAALSIMEKYEGVLSDYMMMEVESYYVLSGILLGQNDLDGLVSDFGSRYPNSPQLSVMKFYQSVYYFEKGDYSRSIAIVKMVDNKYLSKSHRLQYMFNKAYCNMRIGNNDEAKAGFRQLVSLGRNPYTGASSYYLGYLHYIAREFPEAIKVFKELEGNHEYSSLSRYYISESYFMMNEYKEAISYGEKVYDKLEGDFKLKSVKILSQSYFELDQTREAKKYLEMYSTQSDKLSRKDNYYSGVVSYSLHSYYAAIDAFSKVVTEEDSLAQNGYLYLGNSYLNIKNKLSALEAFKKAASMDYDPTIREEAHFLYAKLAFDLNSDITPFGDYIRKYPSTKKGDEIYSYMATSYLQNKEFKEAIDAIGKVKSLTPEMEHNLQKASFFRAMQLLDMGSYRSAIEYFNISLKHGAYNNSLSMLSKFWLGEAQYRLNDYESAISSTLPLVENKAFIGGNEYPMALFNLGYCYFDMGNYPVARSWFEKYLNLPPSKRDKTMEARTRLADCYYMSKDYERASEIYEDVAMKTFNNGDIYATFMGAMSFGLIAQPQKKISMLGTIVNDKQNSGFYHRAMYELGRTYVQEEEYDDAVGCFNTLLSDKSDSTYYTKSLLELGMVHSNLSKYDQALGYFMSLVERYPLSGDVQSALAGIESVYQLLHKPEEYFAYLDRVGMSSVKTADEKEQMLFNSAEQLFLANRYQEAIPALLSFIEKYPEGARTPQAYFYLAESYNQSGNLEFASDAYLKVMGTGEGAFVELATLYYGKIELSLEHFDRAASAFESLEGIAKFENNKFEALLGKMRAYYGEKSYLKSIAAANGVLVSGIASADVKKEAEYKMAKGYMAMGEREQAIPIFEKLAKDYTSEEGSESAYLLVLNAYDEGDFEKVENLVYAFSDAGTSHMYWLAKSFIVLGDSFAERDEWEQAKATFESVKDGYEPSREHDDVIEQVEMRLSKLRENE